MKSYLGGGTALAEAPDILALAAVFFGAMAGVKLEAGRSRGRFFQRQVCAPRGDRGAPCDQPFSLNSTGRGIEDSAKMDIWRRMASNFADLPDPFNNLLRLLLLNVHVWRRKAWPPWLRMHASLRAKTAQPPGTLGSISHVLNVFRALETPARSGRPRPSRSSKRILLPLHEIPLSCTTPPHHSEARQACCAAQRLRWRWGQRLVTLPWSMSS